MSELRSVANEDSRAIEAILRRAKRDPAVGGLLDAMFDDKRVGRLLLLNPTDLLPTIKVDEEEFRGLVRTPLLPYLSRPFAEMFEKPLRGPHAFAVAAYLGEKRREQVLKYAEHLRDTLMEGMRDSFLLALLAVVRENAVLRDLITSGKPLTRATLRQAVKDYSGISVEPAKAHIEALLALFTAGKGRKSLNRMFVNLDQVTSIMGDNTAQLLQLAWSAKHLLQSLSLRGLSEADLRSVVLWLAQAGFLEQSGPLFLWCNACREWPVWGSVPSYVDVGLLPPVCPSCGRIAKGITTFRPADALAQAIALKDGLLGAAVGWHLRSRSIKFRHGIDAGIRGEGEELDFVTMKRGARALIECKMNELVGGNARKVLGRLLQNRDQLRDHIRRCVGDGTKLDRACCVVNLHRQHLRAVMAKAPGESDPDFVRLGARLISYEEFPSWAAKALA